MIKEIWDSIINGIIIIHSDIHYALAFYILIVGIPLLAIIEELLIPYIHKKIYERTIKWEKLKD